MWDATSVSLHAAIGEFLPIVIVLLFEYAEHGEDDVLIMCRMGVGRVKT